MKKGRIWILTGLLLIVAALGLTFYNMWDNLRAGYKAREALEQLEIDPGNNRAGEVPDYLINPEMEMPVKTIDGLDYVGTISIPAIERTLPVLNEWNHSNLKQAPCRYKGTAYMNDLIICAHNYDKHFGPIKNLNYGDRVSFTDMDGNQFRYQVEEVQILQPTAIEEMEAGGWDLTLFTCTIGGRTRVTVRCKKIEE